MTRHSNLIVNGHSSASNAYPDGGAASGDPTAVKPEDLISDAQQTTGFSSTGSRRKSGLADIREEHTSSVQRPSIDCSHSSFAFYSASAGHMASHNREDAPRSRLFRVASGSRIYSSITTQKNKHQINMHSLMMREGDTGESKQLKNSVLDEKSQQGQDMSSSRKGHDDASAREKELSALKSLQVSSPQSSPPSRWVHRCPPPAFEST